MLGQIVIEDPEIEQFEMVTALGTAAVRLRDPETTVAVAVPALALFAEQNAIATKVDTDLTVAADDQVAF